MGTGLAKDIRALGLKGGFSLGELKSAFRARAKLCHPDLGGNGDFSRLRESYERLLDHVNGREAAQRGKGTASGARSQGASGPAAGRSRRARRGPAREGGPDGGRGRKPGPGRSAEALGLYREASAKYDSFQSVNRDRSMELKFLYSLTKKGIALVDLHRFLRLLDAMEQSAAAALALFRSSLELDGGQEWAAEAAARAESLERQLSRCRTLKAEASGGR